MVIYLSQFGFWKLVTSGLARGWHPGRMYPWIVVFRVIVRRWHTIILPIFSSDEWQDMYNYGTAMSHKNIHRKNFTRLFRGVFTYPLAFRRKSEIRKKHLFSACYARNDLKHRQKRTGPYCWVISKHNGTGRMVARVPTLCTRATIAAIVPHNRYDNYYI